MDLQNLEVLIKRADTYKYYGKIQKVVGMTIESSGPKCSIGEVCKVYRENAVDYTLAEVVGFKEHGILLMPYAEMGGVASGNIVESTGKRLQIPVGNGLIGRIINGLGEAIDEGGKIPADNYYSVESDYSNPLNRPQITEKIDIGVKAIDSLLTCGKGQRLGIFAGSGVGKSTLMGMIARNIQADVNVIALVGERGREVLEFINKDLGEEGMKRSVVVVATSDQPAMLRLKCALSATTIAEYFKDQGKNVLLMMDSLTRFAMAQREVGLATGEPPVARGYTPSIYAALPKLLERSGNFEKGSITGLYTVLVEGDDTNEPIADTVRGILDGHIVLSRAIAQRNHYPAIDILSSVSRLMPQIVSEQQMGIANQLRNILSIYYANYDLITIGAYKKGINPTLDSAISKIDKVNAFLQQKIGEKMTYDEMMKLMAQSIK